MLTEVGALRKNTIWIIDDNEFLVQVIVRGLQNEAPNWMVNSFLRFTDALVALNEEKTLPNIILLDYDFGTEGTAKDFLVGMDNIAQSFDCKIFIYSSAEYNAAFEEVLLHKYVFGWIQKPTPFSNLLDLLIYNAIS